MVPFASPVEDDGVFVVACPNEGEMALFIGPLTLRLTMAQAVALSARLAVALDIAARCHAAQTGAPGRHPAQTGELA